jgi:Ser/Thr protein kinase RdoA (MazF antagonist)
MDPRLIVQIIESYPLLQGLTVQPLAGRGGLSGALIWKLSRPAEDRQSSFCLRRWPVSHPSREHLSWIHQVLKFAVTNGIDFIPGPLPNRHQQTIVQGGGYLWEVTRWMPGVADRNALHNPQKLRGMMTALASFHQVAARFQTALKPSPNLRERWHQLQAIPGWIQQLDHYEWHSSAGPAFSPRLLAVLQKLSLRFRQSAEKLSRQICQFSLPYCSGSPLWSGESPASAGDLLKSLYPVQPVIRDVWWDHFLFSGDELTGLIDFGAMRTDVVSCDLARLLGSRLDRTPADAELWERALTAYQQVRPLSQGELELIPWLDSSGVLLGSAQWLRWLLLEGRVFSDWELVTERVEHLLGRLETLLQAGIGSG